MNTRGGLFAMAWTLLLGQAALLAAAPPIHYGRWLKEEVVWIISSRERKSFRKLKTDSERERFVEKFWQRRDPDPATPLNEYKQEHYRRLAFARKMFREGTPGWKTDRGRVYILHGPPDAQYFYNSRSRFERAESRSIGTRRPDTIVWVYHHNPEGRYYRGEIRLVFQPSTGLSRKDLALSDSKTAQDKADQLSRRFFPAGDPSWLEGDVRYRLVVAGPPSMIRSQGTDLPAASLSEFGRYLEDILRSPGEQLEEQARERERQRVAARKLRAVTRASVSFGTLPFDLQRQAYFDGDGWLLDLRLSLPASAGPGRRTLDLYAGLYTRKGSLFDEFSTSLPAQAGQNTPFSYNNHFSLPSGRYLLKVAVREASGGRTGFEQFPVDLSPEPPARIRLGGVLVTDRVEAVSEPAGSSRNREDGTLLYQGVRLLPPSGESFDASGYLFLFAQTWLPAPNCKVSFHAVFIRGGRIIRRLAPRLLEVRDRVFTDYGVALPLKGFAPGAYTLQLRVMDHTHKTFDVRRIPVLVDAETADGGD